MASSAAVKITMNYSPFDQVPNEILNMILYFASSLPTMEGDNPVRIWKKWKKRKSSDFRTVLLLVCRRWNRAALSCASIWASLHYRFPGCPGDEERSNVRQENLWRTHLKLAASTTPLSINLALSTDDIPDGLDELILNTLAEHSPRLKFLEYTTDIPSHIQFWLLPILHCSTEGDMWDYNSYPYSTHTWESLPHKPPQTLFLQFLTHIKITRIPCYDGCDMTFTLLPALSRLPLLTHLELSSIVLACPCSYQLRNAIENQVKLPFISLSQLSLRCCINNQMYTLGLMDLPKLQLLGIEEWSQCEDPRQTPCLACKSRTQPHYREIPVSLPSVSHAVLYNLSEEIFTPAQILHNAPNLTHLTIRSPISYTLGKLPSSQVNSPVEDSLQATIETCTRLQDLGLFVSSCDARHVDIVMNRHLQPLQKLRISRKMVESMSSQHSASEFEIVGTMVKAGRIDVIEDWIVPRFEVEMERMRQDMLQTTVMW